jgi:metal-responsive CopG/Arc/MetJ family transcriptional regulator
MSARSKKFSLRLPPQLVEKIDQAARVNYETRSDFIRESIVQRLNSLPARNGTPEDPYSWESFMRSKGGQSV